ncbi:MAG: flagellar protein FlgN [Lachnospiraceae bacterium]|nr:flagellar protein FlgN [Lachnospiraceae bacterium]
MASLIEELITTLNDELAVYEALVPLADRKSGVIIENRVDELERITEQEQLAAEHLGSLEKKREKIMNSMRTVLNKRNSDLKLDELIELLAKQPDTQRELSALRKRLKETLSRMKTLNDRNSKLIASSLEISDFQLNMIRSSRQYIGNNYTRNAGQFDMSMGTIGSFDARQ